MSNYSVSISRYRTKKDSNGYRYRINYSYISPNDGKRHRSSKGGFRFYKEVRGWLKNESIQFLKNRETNNRVSSKSGVVQ